MNSVSYDLGFVKEKKNNTHNWQMSVLCRFLDFLTLVLKESTSWEPRKTNPQKAREKPPFFY